MTEWTRILAEHYPVEKLPEDLRHGIASGRKVTVLLEQDEQAKPRPLHEMMGCAQGLYAPEEAVSFIRDLRDESDR